MEKVDHLSRIVPQNSSKLMLKLSGQGHGRIKGSDYGKWRCNRGWGGRRLYVGARGPRSVHARVHGFPGWVICFYLENISRNQNFGSQKWIDTLRWFCIFSRCECCCHLQYIRPCSRNVLLLSLLVTHWNESSIFNMFWHGARIATRRVRIYVLNFRSLKIVVCSDT